MGKVMGDHGPRLLGDLVLGGQVEVVGAKAQAAQGVLVLGKNGGSDVKEIVKVDSADGKPAQIVARRQLLAAELVVPRLVGPAEKACQAALHLILKASQALQMIEALVQRLIEADDHGRRRAQARVEDGLLSVQVVLDGVLSRTVAPAETVVEDLGAAARHPARA